MVTRVTANEKDVHSAQDARHEELLQEGLRHLLGAHSFSAILLVAQPGPNPFWRTWLSEVTNAC